MIKADSINPNLNLYSPSHVVERNRFPERLDPKFLNFGLQEKPLDTREIGRISPAEESSSVYLKNEKYELFKKENDLSDLQLAKRDVNVQGKPSVTVVGGGPIGLLDAIEAYQNGASNVVLLEKRSRYDRNQVLRVGDKFIERLEDLLGYEKVRSLINSRVIGEYMTISDVEMLLASIVEVMAKNDPLHFKVFYGYQFDALKLDGNIQRFFATGQGGEILDVNSNWIVGADSKSSRALEVADIPIDKVSTPVYASTVVFENRDRMADRIQPFSEDYWSAQFTANKVFYLSWELSPKEFDEVKGNRSAIISKTLEEVSGVEKEELINSVLPSSLDVSAFKVELLRTKVFAKIVKIPGGKVFVLSSGNSSGNTHHYGGLGFNLGQDDSQFLGEALRDFQTLEETAASYNTKVHKKVVKMQRDTIEGSELSFENVLMFA